MAFSSLRGRPRKELPKHDFGTPETQLKHALRITVEPIDLCLERLLITPQQHWCGLHLRWLHTIRYGAPTLTSNYNDSPLTIRSTTENDPTWKFQREQEYHTAIYALKAVGHHRRIAALAIHNESPAFLNARLQRIAVDNPALSEELSRTLHDTRQGLDLLAHLWGRYPAARPAEQ